VNASIRSAIAIALSAMSVGCSDAETVERTDPLKTEDPSSYRLTLAELEAAIARHDGTGCLRAHAMRPCASPRAECAPRYRLDLVAAGGLVAGCSRATFDAGSGVAGKDRIRTLDAPRQGTLTLRCEGGINGGTWLGGEPERSVTGALFCKS
jgi:hypothetical protein